MKKYNEKLNSFIPYLTDQSGLSERQYDIFSRLLKDRILFLDGEINDATADLIIAQLIYLESENPKKDISLYINSPGGSITAGLAIYDTMNYIRPDVRTICIGQACSMASLLLAAGAKDKRFILPHARVMIHQPYGQAQGQSTDIAITTKELMRIKELTSQILADNTGKDIETIYGDIERDYFMTADGAKDYGIVDKVLRKEDGKK